MSEYQVRGRVAYVPPPAPPVLTGLPVWPVGLLVLGFPLFWAFGLGAFAVLLCAVPMVLLLWAHRRVEVPAGFGLWVLFVAWAAIAVVRIEEGSRLLGFGVRMTSYAGATVLFVYLYNLSIERLTRRRALLGLGCFFAVVVAGGWLGVLLPQGRIDPTLFSLILPRGIAANEYVTELVTPAFAEVQRPYGSPVTFFRPSAPFPYTNSWGVNIALLVPCAVAAIAGLRGRPRVVLCLLLVAAVVPAAATLNRGMYLAVAFGVGYAAVRLAMRRRVLPLLGLIVVGGGVAGVAVVSGVLASLQQRLRYSGTNDTRTTIYQEAFDRTVSSPVLGYGSPLPSEIVDLSVGTQGQIWNVMFSYGFPALFFFVGWFAYVAWKTRRWQDLTDLWLHVCLVVALLTVVYYGYDGPQLAVVMAVAAIALRPADRGAAVPDGSR